jgi:hypothetical protein
MSAHFFQMMPDEKREDPRFMKMAYAIEKAIGEYRDEGGELVDIPIFCATIIASAAMHATKPIELLDAVHRIITAPFKQPTGARPQ